MMPLKKDLDYEILLLSDFIIITNQGNHIYKKQVE